MNQNKSTASILSADKLAYNMHGPTVAPKYNRGYTITAKAESLQVVIKSYGTVLLTKSYPFSREQFLQLLNSFKAISATASDPNNHIVGGSTGSLEFYKDEQLLFKGSNLGGGAKDYTGVKDIDLSYLVKDIDALVESTRTE